MTRQEFQIAVIERSQEHPVMVDFWAEWCGPCRVLGPLLEDLERSANGAWELVKIDTEASRELAQEYKIMSIPAVKLFHKGEMVAEFAGALPRHQIEAWLEEYIPDERTGEFDDIRLRLDAGDSGALAELEAFVTQNPDMAEARLSLSRALLFSEPTRAIELVAGFGPLHKLADQAAGIRDIAELMTYTPEGTSGIPSKLAIAQSALQQKDYETAIQSLIEAVTIDKDCCGELARRATVALFHLLGQGHELTGKYQRRFSMALY